MRYVLRRSVSPPAVLASATYERFREDTRKYLADAPIELRPPRLPLNLPGFAEVLGILSALFRSKCAYCESIVDRPGSGDIDRFRPIAGAERDGGHVDYRHYCWLSIEWDNLYLACAACNRAKKNRFPVEISGAIGAEIGELRRTERAALLDPCYDQPHKHLIVGQNGGLTWTSSRGAATVEILNLNRPELLNARVEVVAKVNDLVAVGSSGGRREQVASQLATLVEEGAPFSGVARLVLAERLQVSTPIKSFGASDIMPLLGSTGANRRPQSARASVPPARQLEERRFVRRVSIKNFRGILGLVIDFPEHGRGERKAAGSLVILGENAVGKTCTLQAAALGTMGPHRVAEAGVNPEWCLSEGFERGHVKVEFWDTDATNYIAFARGDPTFEGHADVDVVVLGYGAYRLPARGPLTLQKKRYDYRVHTLLDERELVSGPYGLLRHLRSGSGSLNSTKTADAARALNALLLDSASAVVSDKSSVLIEGHGRREALDRLSSGFKSIVSIATDLMDVMYEVWDGMTSGQALVLIDELDAHLHPAWRMRVVEALREAFPLSQFLITTHDPLVLRGLDRNEMLVMERDDEGCMRAEAPAVPDVSGLTVDQMLTSDLFGLETTLDTEVANLIAEYYSLLGKAERDEFEEKRVEELRASLADRQPMGDTRRERLLYAIIDRRLSKPGPESRSDIWDPKAIDALLVEVNEAERTAFEP